MRNMRKVSPCVIKIKLVSSQNRPALMSLIRWSSNSVIRS